MINTEAQNEITLRLLKLTNLEFLWADDELLDNDFLNRHLNEHIHVFSILEEM